MDDKLYIPGEHECAKCKLTLLSSNLYVGDGSIGPNKEPQQCPNGCGPMWRVTWESRARESMKLYSQALEQFEALRHPSPVAQGEDVVEAVMEGSKDELFWSKRTTCPACDVGKLYEHHYSICNECGTEVVTPIQARANDAEIKSAPPKPTAGEPKS